PAVDLRLPRHVLLAPRAVVRLRRRRGHPGRLVVRAAGAGAVVRRGLAIGLVALLAVPSAAAAPSKRHHRDSASRHHRSATHKRRDEGVLTTTTPPTRHVVPPPIVPPPPNPLAHLQVIAREWSVIPSRMTLPAGRVVVELDNLGQDPHNLRIERGNDPLTGIDLPLARAGTRSTRSRALVSG